MTVGRVSLVSGCSYQLLSAIPAVSLTRPGSPQPDVGAVHCSRHKQGRGLGREESEMGGHFQPLLHQLGPERLNLSEALILHLQSEENPTSPMEC